MSLFLALGVFLLIPALGLGAVLWDNLIGSTVKRAEVNDRAARWFMEQEFPALEGPPEDADDDALLAWATGRRTATEPLLREVHPGLYALTPDDEAALQIRGQSPRSLPGARWDKGSRSWFVADRQHPDLHAWLRRHDGPEASATLLRLGDAPEHHTATQYLDAGGTWKSLDGSDDMR